MLLYGGIMTINAMLLTGVGSLLPHFSVELGLALPQQGFLVSGQFVGYTAAVLSGAVLADRFGKTLVLRLAMLGFIATTLVYWVAGSFTALLLAFVLTGCFCGVLENILTAIIYLDARDAVRKNTMLQFAFCVGAVALPVMLYGLGTASLSWRVGYLPIGAAMAVLFCFVLRQPALRERESMTFSAIGRTLLSLLRNPVRLLAPLAMLLYVSAEVGLWGFLPTYISRVNGNDALVSAATALLWASMATSRLMAAWLWKASIRKAFVASVALMVASICGVLVADGLWLLPAAALAGFSMGPLYAYLIDWMCKANGSSASMIAVSMALGTLGPILTGPLTGSLGEWFGAKSVMAVPLAACFAILWLLRMDTARKEGA